MNQVTSVVTGLLEEASFPIHTACGHLTLGCLCNSEDTVRRLDHDQSFNSQQIFAESIQVPGTVLHRGAGVERGTPPLVLIWYTDRPGHHAKEESN